LGETTIVNGAPTTRFDLRASIGEFFVVSAGECRHSCAELAPNTFFVFSQHFDVLQFHVVGWWVTQKLWVGLLRQ
jgi:hypothetical protein